MYRQRCRKYLIEFTRVALSQLIGDESAYGSRQRSYNSEHHHHTTYNIIYSKVLHSQRIQYAPACIQRYHHHKEHTKVKKKRILRYSIIII